VTRTLEDAKRAVRQQYPPGDENLYAWDDKDSFVAHDVGEKARALQTMQEDADNLRFELAPQTAVAKLEDWEKLFGTSQSPSVREGSIEQRQELIIARWREHGPSTLPNIKAAARALLGYTPTILEVSRAALTAAHTWPAPGTNTIPGSGSVSVPFTVIDEPRVSEAGAQVTFTITHSNVEDLTLSLEGPVPDDFIHTWPAGTWTNDKGSVTGKSYTLAAPDFAGTVCYGLWQLTISNSDGHAGSHGDCSLFVEAMGRDSYGADGLGSQIFDWAIFYDSTQVGPLANPEDVFALVERWNPAHCWATIIYDSEVNPGALGGYPDDPLCIPDRFVPVA
jgi:uncharacterized protein YmfQ (DUF2313 family)